MRNELQGTDTTLFTGKMKVGKHKSNEAGKFDNGIATNNLLGSDRVIVPVQIIGDQDGMSNKTAWQTDAFYGDPLKGFTALP